MLKHLKIKREKKKLKLNLYKHANFNLKHINSPELLRTVTELIKVIK